MFADWAYRCTQGTKPSCELAQQMVVRKGDKVIPVLTMAFAPAASGKGHDVTLLAPLGVALKQGIAISADGGKPIPFAYRYCDQRGCWVINEKAEKLLASLEKGTKGHAKFTLITGQNLTINYSLAGLNDGLKALDAGQPPVVTLSEAEPAPAAKAVSAPTPKPTAN